MLKGWFLSIVGAPIGWCKVRVMEGLVLSVESQVRVELTYRLTQVASAPVAFLFTPILYYTLLYLSIGFRKII